MNKKFIGKQQKTFKMSSFSVLLFVISLVIHTTVQVLYIKRGNTEMQKRNNCSFVVLWPKVDTVHEKTCDIVVQTERVAQSVSINYTTRTKTI